MRCPNCGAEFKEGKPGPDGLTDCPAGEKVVCGEGSLRRRSNPSAEEPIRYALIRVYDASP